MKQYSDTFLKTQTALKEIAEKLTELSKEDLTSIHVNHLWSWIPYLKDHLEFLAEQTNGVLENLKDEPPPGSKKHDDEIFNVDVKENNR